LETRDFDCGDNNEKFVFWKVTPSENEAKAKASAYIENVL
jgi:hypothetical protein